MNFQWSLPVLKLLIYIPLNVMLQTVPTRSWVRPGAVCLSLLGRPTHFPFTSVSPELRGEQVLFASTPQILGQSLTCSRSPQ